MQLTHVVQIHGDSTALLAMMEGFNRACNALSQIAFAERTFSWLPLQRRAYRWLREEFGLTGVQATVAVRKVAYAYKDKARRGQPASFRLRGGVPLCRHSYRADTLRLYGLAVSYQTRPGVSIPRNASQAVLVYRDGRFFVQQPLNVATPAPSQPADYLGLDLGIVNIAVDSDGTVYAGEAVERKRRSFAHRRRNLQRNGTRAAKRKLQTIRRKQAHYQRDMNHRISKSVVATAQRHSLGIALEDLQGIRERTVARRKQRARQANWAFAQLRSFLEYKAALAGIAVALVDPRYTSQTCIACGHVHRANRPCQSLFLCSSCGFSAAADYVAALNIAFRARADSNQPKVAAPASDKGV